MDKHNSCDKSQENKSNSFKKLMIFFISSGIMLRLLNLYDYKLWTDEIFSTTLAESPLLDLFVAVVRHDVHPPLYYFQLYLWQFLNQSDFWYILNSLGWNIAALVSIFIVCNRVFDNLTAFIAAALFAVLPQQIFFSETVRMYSMGAFLIIWIWYFVELYVTSARYSMTQKCLLVGLGAALNLVHGVGFLVNGCIGLYCLARLYQTGQIRKIPHYTLLFAMIEVFSLYTLIIGSMRSTIGLSEFSLPEIGINLTIVVLGLNVPYPVFAGCVALTLISIPLLLNKKSNLIFSLLFLFPLFAFLLISLTVKPIFGFRPLSMFLPFHILALAVWMRSLVPPTFSGRSYKVIGCSIPAIYLLLSVNYSLTYSKVDFSILTNHWEAFAKKDDVLFVDGFGSDFWGVVRYLNDARLNSALDVQPPQPLRWKKIHDFLGKEWVGRLNLSGKRQFYVYKGKKIYPYISTDEVVKLDRYWLFHRNSSGCKNTDFNLVSELRERHLGLSLCERTVPRKRSVQ